MKRCFLPHVFTLSAGLIGVPAVIGQPAKDAAPPASPASAVPPDAAKKAEDPKTAEPAEDPAYVLGFTMKDIDGNDRKLEQYKGKVVLIVNVASRCGYTPQYEGLERLFQKKQEAGLVVLGFPANNFREQEPGTDAEIKEYCTSKYGVTFPMFSKISVKGEDQHPLFKKLASQPAPIGGDPKWNFTKYLVDRSGRVVAHYSSNAKPDNTDDPESKAMADKIDELLKAK